MRDHPGELSSDELVVVGRLGRGERRLINHKKIEIDISDPSRPVKWASLAKTAIAAYSHARLTEHRDLDMINGKKVAPSKIEQCGAAVGRGMNLEACVYWYMIAAAHY